MIPYFIIILVSAAGDFREGGRGDGGVFLILERVVALSMTQNSLDSVSCSSPPHLSSSLFAGDP